MVLVDPFVEAYQDDALEEFGDGAEQADRPVVAGDCWVLLWLGQHDDNRRFPLGGHVRELDASVEDVGK